MAILVSQSALAAGAKDFEGFNIGANLSQVSTSVKENYSDGDIGKYGESKFLGSLQAGYTLGLTENTTLGVGASYTFGNLSAGGYPVASDEYSAKKYWSVFVEPGYVLGGSTLLYGKIGYAAMNGYDIDSGSYDEKMKVHGAVYGVGIRKALSDSVYLQLEWTQSNFGSKTETADPEDDKLKFKVNQTSLGLGMRF